MVSKNTSSRRGQPLKEGISSSSNSEVSNTQSDAKQRGRLKRHTNIDKTETINGQNEDMHVTLKTTYSSQLKHLKELFSDNWKVEDLISVLQEVQGDLDVAISRISEGYAAHWSTLDSSKKKKDKDLKRPHREKGPATHDNIVAKTGNRVTSRRDKNYSSTRQPKEKKVHDSYSNSAHTRPLKKALGPNVLTVEEVESSWNAHGNEDWGAVSVTATVGSESHMSSWEESRTYAVSSHTETESQSRVTAQSVAFKKQAPVSKKNSKTTWADIAKPAPMEVHQPKTQETLNLSLASSVGAVATERTIQPKDGLNISKTAPAESHNDSKTVRMEIDENVTKTHVQQSNKSSKSPPGLAQANSSPTTTQKHDVSVIMPVNSTLVPLGVKFGSLSLNDGVTETVESQISSTDTNGNRHANNLPSGSASHNLPTSTMQASTMINSNNYPVSVDYNQGLTEFVSYTPQPQRPSIEIATHNQTNAGPAYPVGVGGANLANMYAAYFPYYMNQYPGANPYGSSNPPHPGAAGYNQQGFPSMKYPVYPINAAPLGNGQNAGHVHNSKSHMGSSNIHGSYSGFNPYYSQQPQSLPGQSPTEDTSQEAYKYGSFIKSGSKPAEPKMDKSNQGTNAYYNQYMHANLSSQFPNYAANSQASFNQAQNGSGTRSAQQQHYWGNQN